MSNRRLRRAQERLLNNKKKVRELMKIKPPTDEDIEWYIQRQAQKAITEGTKSLGPIKISDELAQQLKDYKHKSIVEGHDKTIKDYYEIK